MPEYHDSLQQNRLDVIQIQEYFAKMNPIAERIYNDIKDTKLNYGKLWDSLNYHEQNDIINDTLIKPEISLHYFDNFNTPTQSNSTKSQTSTDSLAAIVLGSFEKCQENEDSAKNCRQDLPLKQCYGFDSRDLRTYSIQTVALKVIQDDALGSFRDEYSSPFSYRTKSQINLHIFHGNESNARTAGNFQMTINDTKQEPMDVESKKALLNYHRLQCELKKSLNQNLKSRPSDMQKDSSVSVKPSSITSPNPSLDLAKNRKGSGKLESTNSNEKEKIITTKSKPSKSSSSIMQVFLNSNNSSAPPSSSVVNYAVYTDSFLDGEENTNLMQNCGGHEFMSASSSVTSEEDEYDSRNDKNVDSEEVFLLDRDLNMRKGFDFLNNW